MKLDWKNLFNWEITGVKAPEFVKRDGVAGYVVVVDYLYHGRDEEFFSTEEERLYKVWAGPEEAAHEAYQGYLKKMQKQALRKAQRAK